MKLPPTSSGGFFCATRSSGTLLQHALPGILRLLTFLVLQVHHQSNNKYDYPCNDDSGIRVRFSGKAIYKNISSALWLLISGCLH